MKNTPEKSRQVYWKAGLLSCLLLLVAAGALFWLAVRGEFSLMLYQLAVLLLYPAGVLLISSLFSILGATAHREKKGLAKKEKKPAKQRLKKALPFLKKKSDATEGTPAAELETQETDGPAELYSPAGEELTGDTDKTELDGLQAIVRQNAEERTSSKTDLRTVILGIAYVAFHAAFAVGFIYYSFTIAYPMTEGYFAFSYLHAAIMLIAACTLLVSGKLMAPGDHRGNRTASDLMKISGALMLTSAVAVVLWVMFGLNSQKLFFWAYRVFGALLVFDLALALVMAGIKRTMATDFSYCLLPGRGEKGERQGFISALEEHTGISLKSLWSIKYLGQIAPGVVLGLLLLIFLSTCVYVVSPQQQAAVYRFGSFDRESVTDPGIHLKLPWPIDKVELYEVERTQSLQVGYNAAGAEDFFWTQAHDGEEYTLLLGSGTELVSVNMKLMYKIDDLYSYLSNVGSPEDILTARAYEMLMNRTVTTTLDKILTVDRATFSEEFTQELGQFCAEMELGITVTETVIQSIHPPIQIADVYQEVINASLQKNSMTVNAHTAADKALIDAEKIAETAILEAETNQTRRTSGAEYEMSIYYAAFEAWKQNPDSFMLHKYLTTYEKIIGGNKVYVFMPGTDTDLSKYIFGASGIRGNSSDSVIINDELAGGEASGSELEGSADE